MLNGLGNSISNHIGLCDSCDEARFGRVSTDEQEDTVDGESCFKLADKTKATSTDWVKSELLCFISDKCSVLPVDQLVDICVNFYREDEILFAKKVLLESHVRLRSRKGSNKLTATLEDIIKQF